MNLKPKIHFVCRGNIYRSRVAEAYARSIDDKNWQISSSGIESDKHPIGFQSSWAKKIGDKYNISQFFSVNSVQTTNEILQQSDIIIFMAKDIYEDAKKRYTFNESTAIIWQIKDREDWGKINLNLFQKRKRTFFQIRKLVTNLFRNVSHGGWVDIVDENNNKLNFCLPISIANQKGLWHRSSHAVITTPNGNTLVQKRSKSIIFSPGLLDITLGGHVDVGETPKQAIIREMYEEIGIKTSGLDIRLLEIYKNASFHPKYDFYTKMFIYTYHISLKNNDNDFKLQNEEASEIRSVSRASLEKLLKKHSLKKFGKLNYPYAYYSRILFLAKCIG